MPQINLLPWREQVRQEKKIRFIIALSSFVAMAVLFVIMAHFYIDTLINAQAVRNNFLQTELDQERGQLTILNKKEKEQETIAKDLKFITSLRGDSYRIISVLDEITRILPDAIVFDKIIRKGKTFTLIGKARSNMQITLLMESMSKSDFFEQPVLTQITGKESDLGEQRYFELKVQVEDEKP